MLTANRAVSLLALSAWVAIAMPAEGQSGPGGTNPDKRLGAWEKQLVLPPKVSARLAWAQRRLQPSGLRSLEKMGRTLAPAVAAGTGFSSLRDQAEREVAASFEGLSRMDISEAAFIVLSMAAKDMDDDIRMIMAEIKATNAAKQKLRDLIKELNGWVSQEMAKHPRSEDIDSGKPDAPGTKARAPGLSTKTTPPPLRRLTLETRVSPVIPPLPPRDPGLTVSGLKSLRDDIQGNLDGMNEMSEMTSLRLQVTMDRRSKFIETLSNIMKKIGTTQETLVQNIK